MIRTTFNNVGFVPEKYDEAIRQLDAAGASHPDGRISHVAVEVDGIIQVVDIWASQEQFEKFGETLVPILAGFGVDPFNPAPVIEQVHNYIASPVQP